MPNEGIILFIVIPLLGSFFILLENIFPKIKIANFIVIAVFTLCIILLASFAPAILRGNRYENIIGNWNGTVGIYQSLDGLAWLGFALMYLISALSLCFAFAEKRYNRLFYFFFLILLSGMAGVLLASDLFNLFVCLEMVSICTYILISYTRKDRAIWASFKYLLLSSLGMSFFLVGVFIVYKNTGTMYLGGLSNFFSKNSPLSMESSLAIACLVTGIGIKTAFIPFHTWLPEAHSYAPHPVSAILSGVVIKINFLALWRLINISGLEDVSKYLLWVGIFTAIIGIIGALVQTDCKLLLAWSSVSQMGYILAGFGAGTFISKAGSLYHVFSHALFKSLLFLSIGTVVLFTGQRSIKKISGMSRVLPFVTVVFLVGALSISGIPPFNGFVSKKLILDGLKELPFAYWSLWAVSVGTFASFIKLSAIFRGKTSPIITSSISGFENNDFFIGKFSMLILAVLCLSTGIFESFFLQKGIIPLLGQQFASIPNFWDMDTLLDSGASILLGILLYFLIMSQRGKEIQCAFSKFALPLEWSLVLLLSGFLVLYGFIFFLA